MLVLDTNIVIEYSHNNILIFPWIRSLMKKNEIFCISVLSITELFGFNGLPDQERYIIEGLISSFSIIEVNINLAREGAKLRSKYSKLQTVDSIIAASALSLGVPLVTNDKIFDLISEISILPVPIL